MFVVNKYLLRVLTDFVVDTPWWKIVLLVLFHYLSSWGLSVWFEPGAEYVRADTYWYFYLVTATTVGYGDFSPTTLGSRLVVTVYLMPIGIAFMGAVIGKVAAFFVDIGEKIRTGMMDLHLEDHTIVIGDNSSRTIQLLENLLADDSVGKVVLVSKRDENPMNGRLAGFVRGGIDELAVQKRSCIAAARRIIVLGDSDHSVIGRTLEAANLNPNARIIAYFQNVSSAESLNKQTDANVCVVTSTDMDVLVQEALDPGASDFVQQLLTNAEGATFMHLQVPQGVTTTFERVADFLLRNRVNVMSIGNNGEQILCPDPGAPVFTGTTLGVAASSREVLEGLNWTSLQQNAA